MMPRKERAIKHLTRKNRHLRINKDGKISQSSRPKNDGVLLLLYDEYRIIVWHDNT